MVPCPGKVNAKNFCPVTLNPGWVWVIFIKFDFKEKKRGGLEASEAPSVRGKANKAWHLSSETGWVAEKGVTEGSSLMLRQKGFHKSLHCS